ncbi:plasmid recombination protein [Spiroplasma endosymbiont of Polydrusus cervinus]|uniref:plasmid recombination protein n=1 Tax=Spiroplasma endosymbiont of Polydrusus cervinus TaxID=3066287 RepID=UPI0030D1CDDD
MEKEYKFKSSPPIGKYQKYINGAVDKLIRHNFRIKIPENVNPEFTKYNFYYVNGIKEITNNGKGFEIVKQKRFEKMKLLEDNWNKQQTKYSEAQKTSFKNNCEKKNIYIDIILPGTRQEWFEKMGICQFTDIQVWDKFTGTRKMGKLILESINWNKLNEWVNIEINFMKQWMKNNLGTDMGYLYSAIHLDETTPHIHFDLIPINKGFSKKLNEERYTISQNKLFGGSNRFFTIRQKDDLLNKFHRYHANYLTKAGYEIEPGEIGGKGSYNAMNFRQVKEFERNKLENEINTLFDEYRSTKDNIEEFSKIKGISDDYDGLIYEIKQYLRYENNFTDYEINQLTKYLDLAEKMKYYKIITTITNPKESDFKNMSLIEQEFNEMVFKINPIMQKGYDLVSSLEREL